MYGELVILREESELARIAGKGRRQDISDLHDRRRSFRRLRGGRGGVMLRGEEVVVGGAANGFDVLEERRRSTVYFSLSWKRMTVFGQKLN